MGVLFEERKTACNYCQRQQARNLGKASRLHGLSSLMPSLFRIELTLDPVTFALLGPVIIRGDGPHYLSRNELRDVLDSTSFDV